MNDKKKSFRGAGLARWEQALALVVRALATH